MGSFQFLQSQKESKLSKFNWTNFFAEKEDKMINLVTVVGHNTTMLPHMLKHYQDIVDEIFVVVYRQHENDGTLEDIESLGINPYKVVTEPKFNWERVTELYNEVKMTKPNEWWIVSDDDEFHLYPKPIREMIDECDENGWEFITVDSLIE